MNPPGFNIDNAMSLEDVDFQVTNLLNRANPAAIKLWGPMLIEDRHALMSDYRDSLNYAARYGTIADNVALDIEHMVITGADQLTYAIY